MDRTKEIFKSHNYRATAQRVLVYKSLAKLGHATVDQVISTTQKLMPTITVAATYNILESMADLGIIYRLHTDDNRRHYDITTTTHHHLMEQNNADRIEDFDDSELTDIINSYFKRHNIEDFEIEDIRIQIIGKFKQ